MQRTFSYGHLYVDSFQKHQVDGATLLEGVLVLLVAPYLLVRALQHAYSLYMHTCAYSLVVVLIALVAALVTLLGDACVYCRYLLPAFAMFVPTVADIYVPTETDMCTQWPICMCAHSAGCCLRILPLLVACLCYVYANSG